jgi:hypothetical protein
MSSVLLIVLADHHHPPNPRFHCEILLTSGGVLVAFFSLLCVNLFIYLLFFFFTAEKPSIELEVWPGVVTISDVTGSGDLHLNCRVTESSLTFDLVTWVLSRGVDVLGRQEKVSLWF